MNLTKDDLLVIFNTITNCFMDYVQANPSAKENDTLYKISVHLQDKFKSMLKQFNSFGVSEMDISHLQFKPLHITEQLIIDDAICSYAINVNLISDEIVITCCKNCLTSYYSFGNNIFRKILTKEDLS